MAHTALLSPPRGKAGGTDGVAAPPQLGDGRPRAEALLAMEDALLRAYGQNGARVGRFVAALLRGETSEALAAACAPVCGVLVAPMRAEAAKDVQAALAKLGNVGPVLCEWPLHGSVAVFDSDLRPSRAEFCVSTGRSCAARSAKARD